MYRCLKCQFTSVSPEVTLQHQSVCLSESSATSEVPQQSATIHQNLSAAGVILPPTPGKEIRTVSKDATTELLRKAGKPLTATDCASMFMVSESGVKEYKCPYCPHITHRAHALSKHINSLHTKAVWFHCEHCTYRSTDRSSLRRHVRNLHSQPSERVFSCDQCGYQGNTEHHLRRHLLKHESSMLQCPFCSHSTKDRSNFRKHLFVHNQTVYHCQFCKYSCYSPYQLKLHLKSKHQSLGMDDVDCKSDVPLDRLVDEIGNTIKETSENVIGNVIE